MIGSSSEWNWKRILRNLASFWTEQGTVSMIGGKMSENLARGKGQKEAFFKKSNYSKVSPYVIDSRDP